MENKKLIGVFIKDTHLSENTVDVNKSIFNQAIQLCKKYKVPLFHGGDIFTSRKSQSLSVLNTFRDILFDLQQNCVHMHVIAGNHDKTDQEDERSYINAFEKHPNIILYPKQESVEFENDVVIHFMPYFLEKGSYKERLQTLKAKKDKFNLCLTHISVTGVKNNDGSSVENDISQNLFDKFDLTMVAHYHDESWIGSKIWYYPSSYQANYGETTKKGFVLLYSDGSHEFVQSKFKKFIKVKIDIADEKAIKTAEKKYNNCDDNVRFVFEGDEAELKKVSKEKYAALGVEVTFNKNSDSPLYTDGLLDKDGKGVISDTALKNSVSFNRSNLIDGFKTFCELKHIEDFSIGEKYIKQI